MMMGTKSPVYCRHHYSELPISTTATDSSDSSTLTYAIPEYPSNEGIAYSMTMGPIYQQPLCNCHQANCPQQPPTPSASPDCRTTDVRMADNRTESSLSTEKTLDSKQGLSRVVGRTRRPLAWLWAATSLTLLFICVLCMTQPYWLVNGQTSQAIGLLSQVTHHRGSDTSDTGALAKQSYDLLQLPSVSWKVAVVLYSMATALLAVGTLLSFTTILLTEYRKRERLTFISGYVQLFAVVLLTTSILFYMVGLDSPTAKAVCTSSSVFYKGDCQLGWSCVLLIIGAAFGFVLPLLSHYIDYSQTDHTDSCSNDSGAVSNHLISAL